MPPVLRLLAVLAHPDDESLGLGGTLARYAGEGVATHVLTATRGERGRYFENQDRPADAEVGRVRAAELQAAAAELGVHSVALLDYLDGELDRADPVPAITSIAAHIRRVRPDVVVTFDPFGAYGHPDHVAISQLAVAATTAAADASFPTPGDGAAHRVRKLYFFVNGPDKWAAYQAAFKTLVSRVDGEARSVVAWPEWSITTRIDTEAWWPQVWRAVQCHRTQLAIYQRLGELTPTQHAALWGVQTFYRVFSTVNGGRAVETDLFAGIR